MRLPEHFRIQIADRMIRIVAPVMIISMLVATSGLILMDVRQYHRLIPAGITLLAMIPAYLLARRGKPLSGGIVIIFLMNIGLLSGMLFSGGLRAPAYIASLSCITLFVVLYGVRASIFYSVAVLATGGLFIRLDTLDLIPKVAPPPLVYYLLLFGIFLFMQIWFVSIPVRFLIEALKDSEAQGEALKNSERLFKLITEHTSALVSIHDAEGNYVFASASHEQLGYTPEELIGKSCFTLILEEDLDELPGLLEKARKGKLSKASLSYRLKDKTGNIHHFRVSLDGVFKSDRSLEKFIFVGEDITGLRQIQAEKMEALTLAAESNKLALVGQIAGKMAHDFNNVLGVIMGNTELALLDCPHDRTRSTLELIFQQTLRGKNLTRNLVAFARDQEPKQAFFPIEEKMELVLTLLKRDLEGIRIIRNYGQEVPELLADPGMMEHALVNLIQNSIHAVSLVDEPVITIRTDLQQGWIVMEIGDNGCGIPKEFLKDIFEPSFTLKGSRDRAGVYKPGIKGTGYGMANVKKYLEQHRGMISIDSEPEKGTRVAIRLPVIKKELTDQEITEVKKQAPCFEKYILVVEDEPAISDVQYRILTSAPCRHKVDIAGNGEIAMDLVSRNTYDCISLDYTLPGQHNGMDVYHHIRKTHPIVPILFISGNIEFLESIKSLKQNDPHMDHLSKPCMNLDYVNNISALLKS